MDKPDETLVMRTRDFWAVNCSYNGVRLLSFGRRWTSPFGVKTAQV